MFNKKKDHTILPGSDINIIGKGTCIEGEIHSPGDLRIDGKIKGFLSANAKIVIGPDGEVEGDLECNSADIMGHVTGTIKVEELLYLKGNAVVKGDLFTGQFEMEPTAKFNGRCQMETAKQIILTPAADHAHSFQLAQAGTA